MEVFVKSSILLIACDSSHVWKKKERKETSAWSNRKLWYSSKFAFIDRATFFSNRVKGVKQGTHWSRDLSRFTGLMVNRLAYWSTRTRQKKKEEKKIQFCQTRALFREHHGSFENLLTNFAQVRILAANRDTVVPNSIDGRNSFFSSPSFFSLSLSPFLVFFRRFVWSDEYCK